MLTYRVKYGQRRVFDKVRRNQLHAINANSYLEAKITVFGDNFLK